MALVSFHAQRRHTSDQAGGKVERYTQPVILNIGLNEIIMVREYKPGDLSAVVALFARSVREIASRDYTPAQVSVWAPQAPDLSAWSDRLSKGTVFVYEVDHEIVGFARVEETGYFDLLYVHPESQRQGIARALFKQVLAWALRQGITRIISDVSITARPFFEHEGFHVVKSQVVQRRGVSFQNFQMALDVNT
jgi:GNAT superfamily N-acetyltransferase